MAKPKSRLMERLKRARRPRIDIPMAECVVDLGRYLGMPVRAEPRLEDGAWGFSDQGEVLIAHDLWEKLAIATFEFELLTEIDDDDPSGKAQGADKISAG